MALKITAHDVDGVVVAALDGRVVLGEEALAKFARAVRAIPKGVFFPVMEIILRGGTGSERE